MRHFQIFSFLFGLFLFTQFSQNATAQLSTAQYSLIGSTNELVNANIANYNADYINYNSGNVAALSRRGGRSIGKDESVSLSLNIRALSYEQSLLDLTNGYDLTGTSSFTLNLRILSKGNWALRLGAGYQDIEYTLAQPTGSELYSALRKDYLFSIGFEKHFHFPILDIYPGIVVPVAYVGDDEINQNVNIENGKLNVTPGVILGANVRLLRIFRVGVEFYATYENFKQQFIENNAIKELQLKDINYNTEFVIGVAF